MWQVNLFIQLIFIGYLLCSKHSSRTEETVVNNPDILHGAYILVKQKIISKSRN